MKLHFFSSAAPAAQQLTQELIARYGQTEDLAAADVMVAVGGDGTTLQALQAAIPLRKPVFGLNKGHAGYMQNQADDVGDLLRRIAAAERVVLSPLTATVIDIDGNVKKTFAINEIHICNHQRAQAIYLTVSLDGLERVPRLGGDGLIVATTIGSTGYNKSARGPVLPLGDDLIALTPNNAFTPDRMRAAVIRPCRIDITVIDPAFRQAEVIADTSQLTTAARQITVSLDPSQKFTLLYDPGYSLHEKVMRSQFSTAIPH